jgi:malic enzyme
VQALYGKQCLVHWEDFGPTNARLLLEKYRKSGPTFNDDIQSTAAVVLACVLGAVIRASVPPLVQQKFVFAGAGQASLGSAALLVSALVDEVCSPLLSISRNRCLRAYRFPLHFLVAVVRRISVSQ